MLGRNLLSVSGNVPCRWQRPKSALSRVGFRGQHSAIDGQSNGVPFCLVCTDLPKPFAVDCVPDVYGRPITLMLVCCDKKLAICRDGAYPFGGVRAQCEW